MHIKSVLLIVILAMSVTCSNKKKEQISNDLALSNHDLVNSESKLTQLAQTVLNLPSVVKLSKSKFIQRKYGNIFVFFDENKLAASDSVIQQNGIRLKISKERKTEEEPCYIFKKIDIQGDTASVLLHFDITGFICYGELKYVNNKWVPDEDFKVGFR